MDRNAFRTTPFADQPGAGGVAAGRPVSWQDALRAGSNCSAVSSVEQSTTDASQIRTGEQVGASASVAAAPASVRSGAVAASAPGRTAAAPRQVPRQVSVAATASVKTAAPSSWAQPAAVAPQTSPRRNAQMAASHNTDNAAAQQAQPQQQPDAIPDDYYATLDIYDDAQSGEKHSLPRRLLKPALWAAGATAVFALSFAITVAPAYVRGDLRGGAQANTASSDASADAADSQSQTPARGNGVSVPLTGSAGADSTLGVAAASGNEVLQATESNDMVGGVRITARSQPLPDSYGGDPGAVAEVARNLGANVRIGTDANWGTAYMLEREGVQVVLFANRQLLVIAQAHGKLSTDAWRSYIQNYGN